MTVIEQHFMNAAIAYFNRESRRGAESLFIELTAADGGKILLNKTHIQLVTPYEGAADAQTIILLSTASDKAYYVTESYEQVRAMLRD